MPTNTRSENVITIATHPDFERWVEDWKTLNDLVDGGETTIKEMGRRYLPATSGQVAAWNRPILGDAAQSLRIQDFTDGCSTYIGQGGYAYYLYMFRAVFYEYPAEIVRQMIGRMTSNGHEIELATNLSYLEENATPNGETFETLIANVMREQCKYSRCGILADFPASETVNPPYLCIYGALRIINWATSNDNEGREKLDWILLDESRYVQHGIDWEYKNIIRVCALDESGDYYTHEVDLSQYGSEQDLKNTDILKPNENSVYPVYRGKKSKVIPFVFINATSLNSTPENPILKSIASTSLAIYRGEADYRQALFMQGQATPVFSGATIEDSKKFLLGANGCVASSSKDFKASFMEVDGNGLSEMRKSQKTLHEIVANEGVKLINSGGQKESGEALRQRTFSQTISLMTIADTCEAGLRKIIGIISDWGGISEETTINLNKEFTSAQVTPAELAAYVGAYNSGAPVTLKDIHDWAREGALCESDWEDVEADLVATGRDFTPDTEGSRFAS